MPYALLIDGMVDTISYEDQSNYTEWIEVGIDVFGGFIQEEDGSFTNPDEDNSAITLAKCKTLALRQIDEAAEASRLRCITGGSGQAMTYQQKAAEAAAVLIAADPKPDDYPILVAEIGITAPTLLDVATVVDRAYQQWHLVGASIEALRLGGKATVTAATTCDEARAATEITWP